MNKALSRCYSIADLRRVAKQRIPKVVFDYLEGGADDENTLARNQAGFKEYDLVPRVLIDVGDIDLSTTVLGNDIAFPLVFAPTGMSRLFHHQGEAATSRAAQKAGTIYTLSSMSTLSIEEVAAINDGPKCFQIYVWRDRNLLRDFIRRCRECGYSSLCLTVDLPTPGNRERDLRNGFTVPPKISLSTVFDTLRKPYWLWHYLTTPRMNLGNIREHKAVAKDLFSVIDYASSQLDPCVTWEDAAWMIKEWNGPFAIKGILHPEDARRAVDIGASAIIVSNHGGRQLDYACAGIDALPGIVDAVGEHAEIILDGGIRRGTDVIKALALGARACMIGRPYLYGLSAGGEAGVTRALMLLQEEIKRGLMLTGCQSVRELNRDYIKKR